MKYRNYIFDLYGTLIDIHTDEESPELWQFMAGYLKDHFGTVTTASRLKKDYAAVCRDETIKLAAANGSDNPEIKIEWVWRRLIGKNCSDDEMRKLCVAFREKSRDKLICYKNVHEVLDSIKEDGGRIYLLSNAQRLFTEKELDDTGLTGFFDDIFISSDMGVKKPDASFINSLMAKHGLIKSETVMVGNEISADIGSAIAAGIDGIYLNTYCHTPQELDADLAACGYDSSGIELTIIDDGDDCFKSLF